MGSFDLNNTKKLNDLRDRVQSLAKTTGHEPMSWHEFKRETPREEPATVINMVLGSVIGLAAGLGLGLAFPLILFPLAIGAALIGGAAGAFSDTETTRGHKLMNRYENYLNGFEALGTQKAHGILYEQSINYKSTHAAEVLAERQANNPAISR